MCHGRGNLPREGDSVLEARIAAYELAYRMQSHAPEAGDLSKETEATKKRYGIGEPLTDEELELIDSDAYEEIFDQALGI